MKGVESRRSGHRTLTKLGKNSAATAHHISDPPQLRPPRIGRTSGRSETLLLKCSSSYTIDAVLEKVK